ncbi:Glycosyltransferase family 4 protein [Sulfidibacter corallicola]|uniref:Glycosyltransferase family 4 protein n=1 Tax=Sulfidibacter corallicola TaxID=2818388 RepID=A0A8A4THH3_SULCO|nr:glycosyltransferase family 4 protein [Sulfidibacter corallicola]QTD49000.1 glycosyltransferase family 4 protein [Sulfidibacter corallicola]
MHFDAAVRHVHRRTRSERSRAVRQRLLTAYEHPDNLIGVLDLRLKRRYDVILIDQGYGGVWVNTVQIFKMLRRKVRTLLISPVKPLFEDDDRGDVLTLEDLRQDWPELSYFSFVHLVRGVIATLKTDLLLISHRSQSLFLFDLVGNQPTVIYCDGFCDPRFALGRAMAPGIRNEALLRELFFVLAASPPSFFGILSDPSKSFALLTMGRRALCAARENWCWGEHQRQVMTAGLPHLNPPPKFVPPFIDTGIFRPSLVDRTKRVLFTTTMHNIDKKGLPELLKVMGRVSKLEVHCVVRQPEHLPKEVRRFGRRIQVQTLPRRRMIEAYHRVWFNCRVSREESSPVSILEAMACELPQIVSPAVARQIPIIEDGTTGFVIDPDDTNGFCRAVRTLLEDPKLRDCMGRACRERVLAYDLHRREDEVLRFVGN